MLERQLAALDDEFAFVAECNEGGEFMDPEKIERLQAIAARTWLRTLDDRIGISQEEKSRKERTPAAALPAVEHLLADKPEHIIPRAPADAMPADNPWGFRLKVPQHKYNRGELYNLAIARGTLTEEERYSINDHIVQTIIMLSQLPFPKHLRRCPRSPAGTTRRWTAPAIRSGSSASEMPLTARMMAIADIFEALTAADRPYKKAQDAVRSAQDHGFMKRDQHIDPDLFELFLTSGVYRRYAERFLPPEQIDEVDIAQYPRPESDAPRRPAGGCAEEGIAARMATDVCLEGYCAVYRARFEPGERRGATSRSIERRHLRAQEAARDLRQHGEYCAVRDHGDALDLAMVIADEAQVRSLESAAKFSQPGNDGASMTRPLSSPFCSM